MIKYNPLKDKNFQLNQFQDDIFKDETIPDKKTNNIHQVIKMYGIVFYILCILLYKNLEPCALIKL